MRLTEKFKITPFAKILPLFALGILLAGFIPAPVDIVLATTAAIWIAAWKLKDSAAGPWYTAAAIVLTGVSITLLNLRKDNVPKSKRVYIATEITSTPYTSGRWQRTTANIGYYKIGDSDWLRTNEKIELYIDTSHTVVLGEQIAVSTYLNPIDTTGSRYGALMRSRGMNSRAYIVPNSIVARMDAPKRSPGYYSGLMQEWMTARIDRLRMDSQHKSMVKALVAGSRTTLDRDLRAAYSRTGTAHILAVSGLHMGFVFIIINLVFGWTTLLRRGHLVKNVAVIVAIWLYAMCAGLSPSVVRAALMLSAAQVALFNSVRGSSYNIILACATLMLAVNPFYLFDVSFQLSFAAVLSIIFFYPRLYRRKLNRNRLVDTVWSSLLLGFAAQIGVLPIVAYNFGNIPIVSVLINPAVIFTAFIIILLGLVWVLLPFGFLNLIVSKILGIAVILQNGVVLWGDSLPVSSVNNVNMPGWGVALFYLILGTVAFIIKINEERSETSPKLSI